MMAARPAMAEAQGNDTGPDARGIGLLNFSAWIRSQGWLRSMYRHLPQRWRDRVSQRLASRAVAALKFPPSLARADMPAHTMVYPPASFGAGVNLIGYFRGQFGLGENARLYTRSLMSAGYRVAIVDLDIDIPHGLDERSLDGHMVTDLPYPVNLVFVNPDHLDAALERLGRDRLAGRYTMACWFWELERFPDEWRPALQLVDEILVATHFVEKVMSSATDKPVTRVPIPIDEPVDSGRSRHAFGIGPEYTFLTTFDFNSFIERKNPFAAIKAFRLAFPANEPVRLLIKSSNGHRHPELLRKLLNAVAGEPRIVVRDDVLPRGDVQALQRCTDAYVSLHRSEGFGLGMAEAMRLGKPVIGTAYSGNLDFMTPDNSCLVDYTLRPVADGEYMHTEGQHWADADVAQAATFMRRLASDPSFGSGLGRRAARDIREGYSPSVNAALLIDRIEAVAAAKG